MDSRRKEQSTMKGSQKREARVEPQAPAAASQSGGCTIVSAWNFSQLSPVGKNKKEQSKKQLNDMCAGCSKESKGGWAEQHTMLTNAGTG
jgi:hypothetical protein